MCDAMLNAKASFSISNPLKIVSSEGEKNMEEQKTHPRDF